MCFDRLRKDEIIWKNKKIDGGLTLIPSYNDNKFMWC